MGLLSKYNMADSQKKLVTVPETLLKKRKQNAEHRAKRAKAALLMKKQNREKRKVYFKRAEKYVKEYRVMERDQIRLARQAKKHGNFYVPPQPKLALVIRIRGINGIHPRPRKVLQLFRLRQINNATLVRLNKATIHMLRIAESYFSCSVFARSTTLPSCVSTRQPFTCSVLPSLTSVVPSSPDQQRYPRASQQGNHSHAPYCRALHHNGLPQLEERTRARLQAWFRQGRRPSCTPDRQRYY